MFVCILYSFKKKFVSETFLLCLFSQSEVSIVRKGSGIAFRFSLHFLNGRKCYVMNRQKSLETERLFLSFFLYCKFWILLYIHDF